jgi:hypothetical protein
MRTHKKRNGISGFHTAAQRGIRVRCLIQEKAQWKARVVTFFETYGLRAILNAVPNIELREE